MNASARPPEGKASSPVDKAAQPQEGGPMNACPWPVAQLLPHSGNAILLDSVDGWNAESLHATAVIKPGGLYNGPDGSLPPWMGLEIMAQAVGAWAGCQARSQDQAVGLGFLLGTRRYDCHVAAFPAGMRLSVRAVQSLQDAAGMGVFECELRAGEDLLALARLNVYRPADASAYTREAAPDDRAGPAASSDAIGATAAIGLVDPAGAVNAVNTAHAIKADDAGSPLQTTYSKTPQVSP